VDADARVEKDARGKKQIIVGDTGCLDYSTYTQRGGLQIYPGSFFFSRRAALKVDRANSIELLAFLRFFDEREKGIEKCPVFTTFRANELSNASSRANNVLCVQQRHPRNETPYSQTCALG